MSNHKPDAYPHDLTELQHFYAGCNLDRRHSADHYQRLPFDGLLLF